MDQEYALSIIGDLRKLARTHSGQNTSSTPISDTSRKDNNCERKVTHNISQRFKKERPFDRKTGRKYRIVLR